VLEERDIQVRGYALRLPLDLLLVASANPEDYTNRGRIITPLKDRFGAQIRTHYPLDAELEASVVEQEARPLTADGLNVQVPAFMAEIVAEMSQQARRSPHINQRSGVSVRLSIANYETLVANATRRALRHGETEVVPRVSDLDALVASTAGKVEFETVDDGREELGRWFVTPLERQGRPRDELAIKLAMALTTPGVDVRAIVQTQRTCTLRTLRDLTRLKAKADPARDAAWLLAATRELDDVILRLRTNELAVGTWLLRTEGDVGTVAAYDEFLLAHRDDWLVNETIGFYKRTVKRLDTTSRSLFALIEPGSCFVGALAEIAFAADRSYMLEGQFEDDDDPKPPATIRLDEFNTGLLPMGNDLSRLQVRFLGSAEDLAAAEAAAGRDLLAADAAGLGLVTGTPDDIDWEDEVRLVIEERASFSPDALTGMEANLRFAGRETAETKVFGRLTAWQNWIFQRPNAAGPEGALRRYGTGQRADYDRKRV